VIDDSNTNLVGVSDDGSHGNPWHNERLPKKAPNRYVASVDGGIGLSQRYSVMAKTRKKDLLA
jgi:hypothetical protein